MIKNLTIRKKIIMLTILVISSAVIISGAYFFYTYYITLRNDSYNRLNSSIDQAVASISNKFEMIDNTSFAFFSTSHMRGWQNREIDFEGDNSDSYNNIANLRSEIETNLMFNNAWLSKYIDTVYLFADKKCIYLVSRKANSLPQGQLQNEQIFEATKNFPEMNFYYLSGNTVYMIRKINDITLKKHLTLIFTISSESISQELYHLDPKATANIISSGKVFFSNRSDLIGKLARNSYTSASDSAKSSDSDRDSYFIVHRSLYNSLFTIEVSVPRNSIMQQVLHPLWNYVIVMIIFIVLFSTIAGFIAGMYTKFIKDLAMGLNQVRNKNYDVVLPDYRDADLSNICSTFNSMASEIKELINTVYKSKLLLKDNEIKLLQSQMNPHFLVNTLTTISTTALLHKDEQIYHMVTALSNILEASLHSDNPFTTVEKELDHINCYLYIQSTRFQDKLNYSIHIESNDLLQLYIPRLSIEPLVENSVIHGIEDNLSDGLVTISIRRDGDDLLATVTDNGKGFDPEKALKENRSSKYNNHNIGINNTNKRIQFLFGDPYGIHFESEPFVKTCAYIRFPILTSIEGRQITS